MVETRIVLAPGGYVPRQALSFGAEGAPATGVDVDHPLPVTTPAAAAATTAPLTGSTATSGASGTFAPQLSRPIWLTLSGSWRGTVALQRSSDGGVTWNALTYGDGSPRPGWTGALQAAVGEESVAGALYRLAITIASGTLSYRMEQ